jgi:two-component system, sensor histidine kinase and response regulator
MSTILVIEDETAVRCNMLELLEAEGFRSIGAEGGGIGVNLAREIQPDLILCDVMMGADMDGYGVLETLRQLPETATIPFIFVTAKTTRADFRQGMQLGADDYLTKPFTRQELLDAIAIRVSRNHQVLKLQQQMQDLREMNVIKDDMLSTVSHDMRAPLMNMKMAIEMLQICGDSPKRDHYLEILRDECLRESQMVDNLLDLKRLESRDYKLTAEPLDLAPWLTEVVERFRLRTDMADQRLCLQAQAYSEIPSPNPSPIACDRGLIACDRSSLERVVVELINNACKYTPSGGTIEVIATQSSSQPTWTLTVQNQATIAPEALPHIFDKFYRGPKSQTQATGSGLGLALVKEFVQRLGGTIAVSCDGGWTRFAVELPMTAPPD